MLKGGHKIKFQSLLLPVSRVSLVPSTKIDLNVLDLCCDQILKGAK